MSTDDVAGQQPLLRIVHGGQPTPEELAALVVALDVISAPATAAARRRTGWADRGALRRGPLDHGPGRWAASGRPSP